MNTLILLAFCVYALIHLLVAIFLAIFVASIDMIRTFGLEVKGTSELLNPNLTKTRCFFLCFVILPFKVFFNVPIRLFAKALRSTCR